MRSQAWLPGIDIPVQEGKWKEKKESPVLNNFIKRANAFHFAELGFINFLFKGPYF